MREALGHGLSWRNVTELLHGMTGQPQTLAGVHKRYRHLQDSSDQEGRPGQDGDSGTGDESRREG